MSFYSINNGLFDIGYLLSIYPQLDLSYNLYLNVCYLLDSNKKQLQVFKDCKFRDSDTRILLVDGTEELIRKLERFKFFLQKYKVQNENEIYNFSSSKF